MNNNFNHIPVLLDESLNNLQIKPNGIYVDCTIGGAGHSFQILKKLNKGVLIGFDKDEDAIKASTKKLSKNFNQIKNNVFEGGFLLFNQDFKEGPETLKNIGIDKVDGILIDLGTSSYQIDTPERGFSYRLNGKLDMRMDCSQKLTAKDIVNDYSQEDLSEIFKIYGEEEFSNLIAKKIVEERAKKQIETTLELNNIIEGCLPKKVIFKRGGASKKVFQALRIVVNNELENLATTISKYVDLLNTGGRICIISFHSLEDRIVKSTFKELSTSCICPSNFPKCICNHKAILKLITKKPIIPSFFEQKNNSRCSSAKLRVAEKL